MDQHDIATAPYTTAMARFVARLRYETIPPRVIERIKLLILDSFGCALFGAGLPWSQIMLDTLLLVDQTPASRIWGTSQALNGPHAALMNGALIQSFELDDIHRLGVLHVGAATLPAVLAAERLGLPAVRGTRRPR